MPTINQIVRKGRSKKTRKSKSPVLGVGLNTIQRKQTKQNAPQKRGILVLNADDYPVGSAFDFDKAAHLFQTEA